MVDGSAALFGDCGRDPWHRRDGLALAAFGLLADHVDRPRRWSATLFATTVVGRIVDEGGFPVRNSQQPTIPTITYGGDHTFRTSMIVGYYRLRHGRRDRLLLLVPNADTDRDPRNAPEWYLLHTFDHEGEITPFDFGIRSASKVAYSLVATYRHYGPSGWTWGLYHGQR